MRIKLWLSPSDINKIENLDDNKLNYLAHNNKKKRWVKNVNGEIFLNYKFLCDNRKFRIKMRNYIEESVFILEKYGIYIGDIAVKCEKIYHRSRKSCFRFMNKNLFTYMENDIFSVRISHIEVTIYRTLKRIRKDIEELERDD